MHKMPYLVILYILTYLIFPTILWDTYYGYLLFFFFFSILEMKKQGKVAREGMWRERTIMLFDASMPLDASMPPPFIVPIATSIC